MIGKLIGSDLLYSIEKNYNRVETDLLTDKKGQNIIHSRVKP